MPLRRFESRTRITRRQFRELYLIALIREAVGDKDARLMQAELVERCRYLKSLEDKIITHPPPP